MLLFVKFYRKSRRVSFVLYQYVQEVRIRELRFSADKRHWPLIRFFLNQVVAQSEQWRSRCNRRPQQRLQANHLRCYAFDEQLDAEDKKSRPPPKVKSLKKVKPFSWTCPWVRVRVR